MEALSRGPHASAKGEWDPAVCHREKREGEAWASAAGWAVAATWAKREGRKAGLGKNGSRAAELLLICWAKGKQKGKAFPFSFVCFLFVCFFYFKAI